MAVGTAAHAPLGAVGRFIETHHVKRAMPAGALVLFIIAFGYTQASSAKWLDLGTEAMYLGAAAIGINMLLGYTGLLSLGHAGFLIAGGYAGAVFTPYLIGGHAMPGRTAAGTVQHRQLDNALRAPRRWLPPGSTTRPAKIT